MPPFHLLLLLGEGYFAPSPMVTTPFLQGYWPPRTTLYRDKGIRQLHRDKATAELYRDKSTRALIRDL